MNTLPKHSVAPEVLAKARSEAFGSLSHARGPWKHLRDSFKKALQQGPIDDEAWIRRNPEWKRQFLSDPTNVDLYRRCVAPDVTEAEAHPHRIALLGRYAVVSSQHEGATAAGKALAAEAAAKSASWAQNLEHQARVMAKAAAKAKATSAAAQSASGQTRPAPSGEQGGPPRRPRR